MEDINAIQQTLMDNVTKDVTTGIQDQLSQLIAMIIVPVIIILLVILVLLLLHMLRRRKIENAILEIRDLLRDTRRAQTTPVKAQTESVVTSD